MERTFNDKMGHRSRSCRWCIVYNGKAYSPTEAEDSKLAVFQVIASERGGKWSNCTWKVTTRSAKLVIIMSPWDGWSDDINLCVEHVQKCYDNENAGVTEQEALLAFQFLYPNEYQEIQKKSLSIDELI